VTLRADDEVGGRLPRAVDDHSVISSITVPVEAAELKWSSARSSQALTHDRSAKVTRNGATGWTPGVRELSGVHDVVLS
jgi:hypothetical protein